jgi:tRNA/rRNA methyltransferase
VIKNDRASRQAWLEARGYRVVRMPVSHIENDLANELGGLESCLGK